MMTSQRKALILDRLKRTGEIVARDLAAELGLSEDTIRRDLRELAGERLLQRVHGGALPLAPPLPDLAARKGVADAEKGRLGAAAARLIKPGSTVFLDGGTTHVALIHHLPRDIRLTVITHSPTIAAALQGHTGIDLVLIGGRIYRHSMVAVGAEALSAIQRITPDLFFLGVTAIHPEIGLTTGDYEEAAIKRAIMGRARETHVLLTAEKFGLASPFAIAPVEAASGLVVPEGLAGEVLAPYAGSGPTILSA